MFGVFHLEIKNGQKSHVMGVYHVIEPIIVQRYIKTICICLEDNNIEKIYQLQMIMCID